RHGAGLGAGRDHAAPAHGLVLRRRRRAPRARRAPVTAQKPISRVLIVGAGIMGLCTAWALARAGVAVTVIEQAAVPNQRGSSVDQHRLIRYPYAAMRGYTRMVGEAYAAWDRLWRDLGETLYTP